VLTARIVWLAVLTHVDKDGRGTALQGAASIAGLLITTEAMLTGHPKKEAAPPPMPGAGMGGMGGMDF